MAESFLKPTPSRGKVGTATGPRWSQARAPCGEHRERPEADGVVLLPGEHWSLGHRGRQGKRLLHRCKGSQTVDFSTWKPCVPVLWLSPGHAPGDATKETQPPHERPNSAARAKIVLTAEDCKIWGGSFVLGQLAGRFGGAGIIGGRKQVEIASPSLHTTAALREIRNRARAPELKRQFAKCRHLVH